MPVEVSLTARPPEVIQDSSGSELGSVLPI